MRKTVLIVIALFICPFLLSEEVVVVLEGGKSLRGTIVKEDDDKMELKLSSGATMIVERSKVQKIMTEAEVQKEFEKRYAEVNKEKADDLYELAKWCDKYGLREKYGQLLREVVKLSPEHPFAKKELEIFEGKMSIPTMPKKEDGAAPVAAKNENETKPTAGENPTVSKPEETPKGGGKIDWLKGGGNVGGRSKRAGSQFKPKEWSKALDKAIGWISTNPTRINYAPVGQVVTMGFCGLALIAAGAKPGEGQAGQKLSELINACMRATPGLNMQENWGLGVGGMFLCEAYMLCPSEDLRAAIEKIVQRVEANMLDTGGFGHDGSRGNNALGYREVEINSNWIVTFMGMAKQLKVPMNKEKYAMMIEYIKKCGAGGGVGYSHVNKWPATGRTGGAIMAFACCKMWDDPFFERMCAYLKGRMRETPFGHATP
ncbi:MAG: DUF6288 domain-containing protein, partial [Planctomycetota bacterium]|nr:DUF6288 domain-containing protein [Planctomycetota bacterium]